MVAAMEDFFLNSKKFYKEKETSKKLGKTHYKRRIAKAGLWTQLVQLSLTFLHLLEIQKKRPLNNLIKNHGFPMSDRSENSGVSKIP